MDMVGRRLDLVVTEQSPDHGQALSNEQAAAGEAVPQVVDAQVPDARALRHEAPPPVQESGMRPAPKARNHPGAIFYAPYAAQHRDHAIAQKMHDPGSGFGIGQSQLAPVHVHVLPLEREYLPAPAPRQHQQSDGGYRRRRSEALALRVPRRGAETAVLVVREEPFAPALRVFVHEPAGIDALRGHLPDLAHGQHPGWDGKPAQR